MIATRGSQRFEKNMARVIPKTFEMYFIIKFSTNIRGHHVYKNIWTPIIGESLVCKEDKRVEAQELDKNAIGTYKLMDGNETLVGHLPIELSKLISFFIEIGDNHVNATVTGKRKREIGLSVPAKFICFTSSKSYAKILHGELLKRKTKYSYLSLDVEEFCERKQIKFI